MIVILAEKPSQAEAYAKAFAKHSRKKGYYEVSDSDLLGGNKAYITWFFGHLLELRDPGYYNKQWVYSKELRGWDLSAFPIIPEKFEYVIKEGVSEQFNTILSLVQPATEIIIATDPDREGENIAVSYLRYNGVKTPTKRLWINSLEKEAIRDGFNRLKDGKSTFPLFVEAHTRQISDWLVGMNYSALYSTLLWANGVNTKTISVGRVQTPTVRLVLEREEEIKNFVPEPYYMNELLCETDSGEEFVAKEPKSYDDKSAVPVFGKDKAVVTDIVKARKSTLAPKLFNTKSIQQMCVRLYKYPTSFTQSVVEKLYDKTYLSYPRTEYDRITDKEFAYLSDLYDSYQAFFPSARKVNDRPRSRWVSSSVGEHHAIIPTRTIPKLSELTTEEQNIYLLIVKHTLGMFEADYEYDETTVELEGTYYAKGAVDAVRGWHELFNRKAKTEDSLPALAVGQIVDAEQQIREEMTTPPPLLTEATLLDMMDNIQKEVEDEDMKDILDYANGIGTPATRSDIISKIKEREYVTYKKDAKGKDTIYLETTPRGRMLCEIIKGTNEMLSKPELTGEWEKALRGISEGTVSPKDFLDQLKAFIRTSINSTTSSFKSSLSKVDVSAVSSPSTGSGEKDVLMPCPKCSSNIVVVSHPKFNAYACENKACSLKPLWKTGFEKLGKKNITKAEAKKLFKGEKVKMKFKSKAGADYEALGYIEEATGYCKIEFLPKTGKTSAKPPAPPVS